MIKASVAHAMKNKENSLGTTMQIDIDIISAFNSRIHELRVAKPAQAD